MKLNNIMKLIQIECQSKKYDLNKYSKKLEEPDFVNPRIFRILDSITICTKEITYLDKNVD